MNTDANKTTSPSSTPKPHFCGQCGKPTDEQPHDQCAARLELEPPRYCTTCARRMVVQVVPTGWTARCSEHGIITSPETNASHVAP